MGHSEHDSQGFYTLPRHNSSARFPKLLRSFFPSSELLFAISQCNTLTIMILPTKVCVNFHTQVFNNFSRI